MLKVLRHELKYFISDSDVLFIQDLLRSSMIEDRHNEKEGYLVTSIYFDDFFDSCLIEKLDGVRFRKKFRVRYYNNQSNSAKFEIKQKVDNYISKTSIAIPDGVLASFNEGNLSELYTFIDEAQLFPTPRFLDSFFPVSIVEYKRQAFTLPFENIRITIDRHLSSYDYQTTLDAGDKFGHLMIPSGLSVLEIKFLHELPWFLRQLLSSIPARRTAISKYTICRQFSAVTRYHDDTGIGW